MPVLGVGGKIPNMAEIEEWRGLTQQMAMEDGFITVPLGRSEIAFPILSVLGILRRSIPVEESNNFPPKVIFARYCALVSKIVEEVAEASERLKDTHEGEIPYTQEIWRFEAIKDGKRVFMCLEKALVFNRLIDEHDEYREKIFDNDGGKSLFNLASYGDMGPYLVLTSEEGESVNSVLCRFHIVNRRGLVEAINGRI